MKVFETLIKVGDRSSPKEKKLEDDLRSEYDLKSLRVRRLGSRRKSFGGTTVRLKLDVAEIFPNANAVNKALRFLIKVMQANQPHTSSKQMDESS